MKHALRDAGGKASKRISEEDAMQAVIGLWEPERVYQAIEGDQAQPVYLLIFPSKDGQRQVKAVVSANYRTKDKDQTGKRFVLQTNSLTTLGYVDLNDLENPAQYRRIL